MEQAQFGIIYPNQNKAQLALRTLRGLQRQGHIKLEDGAVLVRHPNGELVVAEATSKLDLTHPKYGFAGLAGNLAGVIGVAPLGPAMLVAGPFWAAVSTTATICYDIVKQRDLKPGSLRYKAAQMLRAGSSAVVVEAEIINLEATLTALAELGSGRLIQQSPAAGLRLQLPEPLVD